MTIFFGHNAFFWHTHAGSSRSQCIEGAVKMIYRDFEQVMAPGDSVLVPAGVEHVLKNIGAAPARVKCAHQPAAN
jgi:quercetin dioxygenase-like cupin family protein